MIRLRPYKYPKLDIKGIGSSAKKTGEGLVNSTKKNFNLKEPFFEKAEHRDVNNLWTGYQLGGKGRAASTLGLLGVGAVMVSNPRAVQRQYNETFVLPEQAKEQDVESLISTRGDSQGYQAYGGITGNPNLQASGDLVFALHKLRHGG
ncbi:hypothetical protein P4388_31455 [Bacillus thuringiensis]|nr:hypothetical protein [Bacillus pacificus]MED3353034.1 hypothetical protein [Bacillus thuringiensis]